MGGGVHRMNRNDRVLDAGTGSGNRAAIYTSWNRNDEVRTYEVVSRLARLAAANILEAATF